MHANAGIGDRLRAAREALGYTQKGVADAAGSKFRSWQDYEAGKKSPGSQVIAGLVRLGVNANWVLTGEGPMMLADIGSPGASGPALDRELLKLIVDAVDSGLEAMDLEMGSAKKAELILAIYDFYRDSGIQPDTAKILNFVRSAA